MLASIEHVRELCPAEIEGVTGAIFSIVFPIEPSWPSGPIPTGTGPYGGDPIADTIR